MKHIKAKGISVIAYELVFAETEFFCSLVDNDIVPVKHEADVITANRVIDDFSDVAYKI